MRPKILIGAAISALLLATGSAAAQQQDVQVTSEAIARTCAEIHKNPGAQADGPTTGPRGDLVLNCRLLGAGGMTLGQVSPPEACQRLTGSQEWYRGMGTQVYCRQSVPAQQTAAPRSFTINQDDVAKACQKIHRNPLAMAEPLKTGPSGVELVCRLTTPTGTTMARVSPEEVCETKFGTRDWIAVAGSPTFVCKGTTTTLPNKPPGGGGQTDNEVRAVNDVPLTPEALARGCRLFHGPNATGGPIEHRRTDQHTTGHQPIINCDTGGRRASHKAAEFCAKLSGTPDWYITDFGRGTWTMEEHKSASIAPRFHVCRGPGTLDFHALTDIGKYCISKGFKWANGGTLANKPPACLTAAYKASSLSIGDACRETHRAGPFAQRGVVWFCLPTTVPPPPVPNLGPADPASNPQLAARQTDDESAKPSQPQPTSACPDCDPLVRSIERFEQQIKDTDKRIADEEAYKRWHEQGGKSLTGREREDWMTIARNSGARADSAKQLGEQMQIALEVRKTQLRERVGRCTIPGCREVVTRVRPDLVPDVPIDVPVKVPVPVPAETPNPTTTERPQSRTATTTPATTTSTTQTGTSLGSQPRTQLGSQPSSHPASGTEERDRLCKDHVAELTNGERKFHRLYVMSHPKTIDEKKAWEEQIGLLANALQQPGRQAPGSSAKSLPEPTRMAFLGEIAPLKEEAQECDQVTIFLGGMAAAAVSRASRQRSCERGARPSAKSSSCANVRPPTSPCCSTRTCRT